MLFCVHCLCAFFKIVFPFFSFAIFSADNVKRNSFFIKCQKKREMYSCYFVVKKSQFFFANIYLI